ncbi:hypothetical protein ABI038_14895, partial [Enterococcus faecium]
MLLVVVTFAPLEIASEPAPPVPMFAVPVLHVVPAPATFAAPLPEALVPIETDPLVAVDPPFRLNVPT